MIQSEPNSKVIEFYKGKPKVIEFKCTQCGEVFTTTVNNISGRKRKEIVEKVLSGETIVTFCSKKCSYEYMRENKTGLFSKESIKRNIAAQRANAIRGIGAWSEESERKRAKKRKEHVKNKTGAWSYEARVKQCETKKANGTNQYDPEVTRKSFETQFKNGIGIFSEEGRANQIKWLISYNEYAKHDFSVYKYCEECKEETYHVRTRCFKCDPWETRGGRVFDRDSFYSKKFELVGFESLDKNISFKDIDALNGIPGVWAIFSENEYVSECLEVCETQDIGKEMQIGTRLISRGNEDIDTPDSILESMSNPYKRKKYRDICRHVRDSGSSIVFKIVCINIESRLERLAIESQYAHDNKAVFWSPSPGQRISGI